MHPSMLLSRDLSLLALQQHFPCSQYSTTPPRKKHARDLWVIGEKFSALYKGLQACHSDNLERLALYIAAVLTCRKGTSKVTRVSLRSMEFHGGFAFVRLESGDDKSHFGCAAARTLLVLAGFPEVNLMVSVPRS
eukprot:8462511-Pyramimonas_sp.AAC.2